MFKRHIEDDLIDAMKFSSAVLINGARQVGKSTLAKSVIAKSGDFAAIDLDSISNLSSAKSSPETFIKGLSDQHENKIIFIDEIQRVPELFLPIKQIIDTKYHNIKFLLTGSANIFTLPKLADSLAGRIEIHKLFPLSQGEILGNKENFIDICFSDDIFEVTSKTSWPDIVDAITNGGYPDILNIPTRRKYLRIESYLSSLIERDLRDISHIEAIESVFSLLRIFATRIGGLLNLNEISCITKIPLTSVKRYASLLKAIFIYLPIPAWYNNEEKRIIKSPKIYFNDTAIICHLRGLNKKNLLKNKDITGHILENFIIMELQKQLSWSQAMAKLYHFRTTTGQEVDIILESNDGSLIAIEVKSRTEVNQADFKNIKFFHELTKNKFHRGIVLYSGDQILRFGDKYWALPINCVWES